MPLTFRNEGVCPDAPVQRRIALMANTQKIFVVILSNTFLVGEKKRCDQASKGNEMNFASIQQFSASFVSFDFVLLVPDN